MTCATGRTQDLTPSIHPFTPEKGISQDLTPSAHVPGGISQDLTPSGSRPDPIRFQTPSLSRTGVCVKPRARAKASTTEEPDAGKLHVRVCGGGSGQPESLRRRPFSDFIIEPGPLFLIPLFLGLRGFDLLRLFDN